MYKGIISMACKSQKKEKNSDQFQIKLKMVNPDVVRIDLKSFRKSKMVKRQVKALMSLANS